MTRGDALLEIQDLRKYYKVGKGTLHAVDGVSLSVKRGSTVGLVGESGCGKTTIGRSIVRLHPITSGRILYDGVDIHSLTGAESKAYSKRIQMIFQDPYSSLDPTMPISQIVAEGMEIHDMYDKHERRERAETILAKVGIPHESLGRFPYEFSGGQRQRVGIARAIALSPEFIVCDEPISALDVSIQAQVVNLLQELQQELGLSYLFIAHDLSMVKYISDYVAVMYLGRIVEFTKSSELYTHPMHPYTVALLSAIPIPDPKANATRRRILITGDVPSPMGECEGCRFASRCPRAHAVCFERTPQQTEIAPDHFVACHALGA